MPLSLNSQVPQHNSCSNPILPVPRNLNPKSQNSPSKKAQHSIYNYPDRDNIHYPPSTNQQMIPKVLYPKQNKSRNTYVSQCPPACVQIVNVSASQHAPAPLSHVGWKQHLTSEGSLGQSPIWLSSPPWSEHQDVYSHVPALAASPDWRMLAVEW
jgi:hypothetical protein